MRKKLQDTMFEVSYLFELLISVMVGAAVLVLAGRMIYDAATTTGYFSGADSLMNILDDAIILAIGAELIKMLCKHTPETVIEVLAFALARHLIVVQTTPLENLITVIAIAVLFAVRRFLLNRHDMVETPDGLVEVEEMQQESHEIHTDDREKVVF
ncbi:MAG: hypothetical protein IJX50_03145 [Clostridia bacterium]|nr:hypothetical protein [Clostridia bacterium]